MRDHVLDRGSRFPIIIPVYNEAAVIENVVRDLYEKVIKKAPSMTLMIIEDGSTDGTKEILGRLKTEIPMVLISSAERKGYTGALEDALGMNKAELMIFSDSDGQHEPEDIFKLLRKADGYDIVSGLRSQRRDPLYRIVVSKAYNALIHFLFGLNMQDINSGFKLIKKDVIDTVLREPMDFKYCAMSEFVLKAHLCGYRIKEVPVSHYPRKLKGSNIFSAGKLPLIIIGLLMDLLKIRFKDAHR